MSLAAYVTKNDNHPRECAVCRTVSDDVRKEVDEALRAGAGPTIIGRWLTDEQGYSSLSTRNVEYHKERRHHKREEEQ